MKTIGEEAKHVGAWETNEGYVCFGSWQAVRAFYMRAQEALAAQEAAAVQAVGATSIAFSLRWPNDDRLSLSCVFDTELEAKEYAERCNDSIEIVPLYAALPPSGAREKTS